MSRIDGTLRGSARHESEYAIGYHTCAGCDRETPPPPQHVADRLAGAHSTISTIWPFDQWHPPGWIHVSEVGHVCDRCARAVLRLLRLRKEKPVDDVDSDQQILEQNIRAAIDLAHDGLLTAFPPAPVMKENLSSRFGHRTLSYVWETYADYRQGVLRHRIRQIHNVLLGKPADDDEDLQ